MSRTKDQYIILIMQNCITYITLAPSRYINRLKSLEKQQWTMKGTTMYPALPIAYMLTILVILALSAYMIAYFIINDEHPCYQNIRIGIIILACFYPVESIFTFICLIGSSGISRTDCWKIFLIIFLGLIISGFSFGGLGFVYLCTIHEEHSLLIPASFLSSNTFIQIIVYSYLVFLGLYIVILPLITCGFNAQDNPVKQERGCCYTFCCIFYYFFQIIFLLTALFAFALKLMGPPLLIYVLIEISRSFSLNGQSSQDWLFALSIVIFCLPGLSYLIVYIISNCFCGGQAEEQGQKQVKQDVIELQDTSRKVVFLGNQPSKGFQDDYADHRAEIIDTEAK